MVEKIPVVILCGGQGTRLREETAFKPKPLVEIGGRPILWHIMKIYSYYGFNEFILALGYKGDMIKRYFLNYEAMNNDFTIDLKSKTLTYHDNTTEDWVVTLADTGDETQTGGRIKRLEKYIDTPRFMATYGDGVADINLLELLEFHKNKEKIATLTGLHPLSKYGILELDENNIVTNFKEKPQMKEWVSGGFFVFERAIFDYLDENSILERAPMEQLVEEGQLAVYAHHGFWGSMDTYKDVQYLNKLWEETKRWKVW